MTRPRRFRIQRVEDADRDPLLHGGLDRGGVDHPRAVVGELAGFGVREVIDRPRVGNQARVGGQDTADVGPDLDLLRGHRTADDRGGEVGPRAPERGDVPILVATDEPRDDRDAPDGGQRLGQVRVCLRKRRGSRVTRVREETGFVRLDGRRRDPPRLEQGGDRLHAHALAEGGHEVEAPRRQLAEQREALEHLPQALEFLVHEARVEAQVGEQGTLPLLHRAQVGIARRGPMRPGEEEVRNPGVGRAARRSAGAAGGPGSGRSPSRSSPGLPGRCRRTSSPARVGPPPPGPGGPPAPSPMSGRRAQGFRVLGGKRARRPPVLGRCLALRGSLRRSGSAAGPPLAGRHDRGSGR